MKKTVIVLGLILSAAPWVLAADQAMDAQKMGGMAMDQKPADAKPAPAKPMKHKKKSAKKMDTKAEKYTCPMHPEVISDKPGKCPKCGMDLEKMSAKPDAHKTM